VADALREAIGPRLTPGVSRPGGRFWPPANLFRRRAGAETRERRAYFDGTWLGVALIAPQLLLIFTFFYWPTAQALYWAFTLERPWGGGNEWVGLGNFTAMLSDPVYWNSVWRSVIFAATSTGLSMGLAFMLALFVDRELFGWRIYRAVLVWPFAIAAPALGMAFRFILAPEAGFLAFVNKIWPGLWNPALDGTDAMIAIVVAFAWKYAGYNFIFFLAGLQAMPKTLIEAAALDGAGFFRRVWSVQLPLMMPTVFFVAVIDMTDSFTDSFGIVDIMTQGGPARATTLFVYAVYEQIFMNLAVGRASALAVIYFLVLCILAGLQLRAWRSRTIGRRA